MSPAERALYVEAGDAVLTPLGFKRKKKDYSWRRVAGDDTEWIHLNFGPGVINPSYGVSYNDVEALFPANLGVKCGAWCMLQSLTETAYSSSGTAPAAISQDLRRAVEALPPLHDRQAFAQLLMSDAPPRLFVIFSSDRMRMLPALLASLGRVDEAVDWLARFETIAAGNDRMVPSYDVFAAHFRSLYAPKSGGQRV